MQQVIFKVAMDPTVPVSLKTRLDQTVRATHYGKTMNLETQRDTCRLSMSQNVH